MREEYPCTCMNAAKRYGREHIICRNVRLSHASDFTMAPWRNLGNLNSTSAETFLLRLSLGSSIDDLGGRFLSTVRTKFPQVNILKPLLEARKADLQEVCQGDGVEWIEDQLDGSVRKRIHKIVLENEELVPGITRLMKTCQDARRELRYQGIVPRTRFHSVRVTIAMYNIGS